MNLASFLRIEEKVTLANKSKFAKLNSKKIKGPKII